MEKAVTDQFSQDEIDGLAADDPRFDAALDLRIEMLRGLLGAMEVPSAETVRRLDQRPNLGPDFGEQDGKLANLRLQK